MAFDLSTAKPEAQTQGFDVSTAQAVPEQAISPESQQLAGRFETVGELQAFDQAIQAKVAQGLPRDIAQQQVLEGVPSKSQAQSQIIGMTQAAPTIISGAVAEPVAGLIGGAASLLPGEPGQGARAVEAVRKGMTIDPLGERGQQFMQDLGQAIEPIATAGKKAGELAQDLGASPGTATAIETGITALPELVGLRGVVGAAKVARAPSEFSKGIKTLIEKSRPSEALDNISGLLETNLDSATKVQQINQIAKTGDAHPALVEIQTKIAEGKNPSDIIEGVFESVRESKGAATETARYMLDGAGKVKSDPLARETIKQGFDPGVIASVKGASSADRAKMSKMVETLEKGKANARFAREFRPSDVVGDSILERFRVVNRENKVAGRELKKVAQDLRGKEVDFSDPVSSFLDDLDAQGVKVVSENGKFKGEFFNSTFEDIPAARTAINSIVKRMGRGNKIDALDVHNMKKLIDEQVTFGKTKEGLGGAAERSLKKLRRGLDAVLDSNFPAYDKVNTKYAETIGALDNFKSASGSKFDPSSPNADKFVGTLARRLMGNAQSRVQVMDSLNELQKVANKHGKKFDDDIITQAMFVDELQGVFGSNAPTSFLGDIEKGVKRGMGSTTVGAAEIAATGAGKLRDIVKGVNEENAIKSIKAFLARK